MNWGIDSLASADYLGKIDLTSNKFDVLFHKNNELQKQFEELSQMTPTTADEAQKIADTMASLSDQIIEANKELITYEDTLRVLAADSLIQSLDNITKVFEKQQNVFKRTANNIMNFTGVNTNLSLLGLDRSSLINNETEVDKKRKQYEEMLELQKSYQDKALESNRTYLELLKKENEDDYKKQKKESEEDYNRSYRDYVVNKFMNARSLNMLNDVGFTQDEVKQLNDYFQVSDDSYSLDFLKKTDGKYYYQNIPTPELINEEETVEKTTSQIENVWKNGIIPWYSNYIQDDFSKLQSPELLINGSNGWGTQGLYKAMNDQISENYDKINNEESYFIKAPEPDESTWTKFGHEISLYISNGIDFGIQKNLENQVFNSAFSNAPWASSIYSNKSSSSINSSNNSGTGGSVPTGAAMWFNSPYDKVNGHVGIYGGDGYIYHLGKGVKKNTLEELESKGYVYRGWGWSGGKDFSAQGPEIAQEAKQMNSYGFSSGNCQKWVSQVYQKVLGGDRYLYTRKNATTAGNEWIVNNLRPNQKTTSYNNINNDTAMGRLILQNLKNHGVKNNIYVSEDLTPIGEPIIIPETLGNTITYMPWRTITSKSSQQYKLREQAGENYDNEGYARINGRYVVALTSTFGTIGDYVDILLDDGTLIQAVIGDQKSQKKNMV